MSLYFHIKLRGQGQEKLGAFPAPGGFFWRGGGGGLKRVSKKSRGLREDNTKATGIKKHLPY